MEKMLTSVHFDLKMDRLIDPMLHYISPGGYEVAVEGREIGYDFNESYGRVNKDDRCIVHFDMYDLDTDSFPAAAELTPALLQDARFTEFYVYTGEHGEPEINPVALLSFEFVFDDETSLVMNEAQLESANVCMCE